jgi:hypothetical protein
VSEAKCDFGFAGKRMRKDLSICLNDSCLPGTALINNVLQKLKDGRTALGYFEPLVQA